MDFDGFMLLMEKDFKEFETMNKKSKKQSLEITAMKLPGGGFNAMINDPLVKGTITDPLNIAASDVETAIKNVLANWEKCYLERLEKTE